MAQAALGLLFILAIERLCPAQGALPLAIAAPANQANGSQDPTDRESILYVNESKTELKLVETYSKVVAIDNKIARVDGFDPDIVNVSALAPNRVRVQGVKPGVTTMILVDEFGETYEVEVFVLGDVRHLQAYIQRLFPRASVEAVAVRDSIVLRGWVQQPEHITEIVELTEQFTPKVLNQMKVGGVQQVKLKVKIMEVQRSKIRALGLNWVYLNDNGFLTSTPGALVPLTGITLPLGGPPGVATNAASLVDATITGGIVDDNNSFQGFLEALKQESLLKILAEPELVATNGRPANLLSGGEFPILVPQGLNTVTIEYREFGVRLEAVPIILGQGRVRLELQPEVSERDFTNAVEVSGLLVPGLTVRRVNTQVEMRFGQTFVLAGLISTRDTANTDKVPFFGELPWIGKAFSRKRFEEAETELVIMVTPELVAPLSHEQLPPGGPGQFTDVPTDRELFHDGLLEVPFYGDGCEGCGPAVPADSTFHGGLHQAPDASAINGELAPAPEIAPGWKNGSGDTETVPGPPEGETIEPPSPPTAPVPDAEDEASAAQRLNTGWREVRPRLPKTRGIDNLLERARSLFQPQELDVPQSMQPPQDASLEREPLPSANSGMIQTKPGLITPRDGFDPFFDDLIGP